MTYTVTVYIAAPGTPLLLEKPGQTSQPGHMYYSVQAFGLKEQSFGFAPIEHGKMEGPGDVYHNDVDNYKDPRYSRTFEITEEQYKKLVEFGSHPEKFGFDKTYKDVRNNCVDFTWGALNHAGLHHRAAFGLFERKGYEGSLKPTDNIQDIQTIKPPIPGSPLNSEHYNPMPPNRTIKQYLLSENDLAPEVKGVLPENLNSEQKTNIAAVVNTDPSTCKNHKVFDAYVDGNELGVCYQNKNNKEAFVEKTFDLNLAANTPAQHTVQVNEQIMAQNLVQSQTQSQGKSMSMS